MSDSPSFWERMAQSSWLIALAATVELVLGFILLSFPFLLGGAAVWAGGIILIIAGIMRFFNVISVPGERMWNLLAAFVYLIAGVFMVWQTGVTLLMLTLVIGVAILLGGLLRLAVAFSVRSEAGSVWRFFNAIISLLLGGLIMWTWPECSAWLIGTIIAVEMIFSGWTLIFLALSPKSESI